MSKESGLGAGFYLDGVDLSGDSQAFTKISKALNPMDMTAVNKSAKERIAGQLSGAIDWVTFFNPSAGQAHPTLSPQPRTDRIATYVHRGTLLGTPVASMVSKQTNYDPSRDDSGTLTAKVSVLSNAFWLDWGLAVTAGKRTDGAAANGAGVDFGITVGGSNGGFELGNVTQWAATNGNLTLESVTVKEGSFAGRLTSTAGVNPHAELDKTLTRVVGGLAYDLSAWLYAPVALPSTASIGVNWYDSAGAYISTTGTSAATLVAATQTRLNSSPVAPVNAVFAGRFFQIDGTPGAGVILIADSVDLVLAAPLFGAQAYLHAFAFTGTSVTAKLQHSADNGLTDAFADITGGGFTAVAAAPQAQRIATARNIAIRRWVRVVTTGVFSNAVFAVGVTVNRTDMTL